MKTREVTLFNGQLFPVPQGIQRIDTKATHGWQVRYQGTKYFSDGSSDGSGAAPALQKATKELLARIATLPAPVTLKRAASPIKTSSLPPGISGPIITQRRGSKSRSAILSVLIPRFGKEPRMKSIYIGTENTYTEKRYRAAVGRAIEIRAEVLQVYEASATQARRKEANAMKAAMRQSRAAALAARAAQAER